MERVVFTATFTRLSNGWVRIGMVGTCIILSPKEWAMVVQDMGTAPEQAPLAPT